MRIHLPNSAFIKNIDGFLRGFDPSHSDVLEISADKKWIAVHPVVIAMVGALGKRVGPDRIRCEKIEARSGHYLERMGLFRLMGIESGMQIRTHEESGRFIPVAQIKTSDEQSKFITEIIPLLHLQKQYQVDTIVYILGELVRNVLEHSEDPQGAIVCAQYYAAKNTIRIGIADMGIGIKASINAHHKADSALDALRLALWPGVTGTTDKAGGTDQNAGAGLFFTKSIARANKDYFMLYSGDALYKLIQTQPKKLRLQRDPFRDKHTKKSDLPFWRGTVVGIDITLDQTQEFNTLLHILNQELKQAVAERKRMKYKRPRFL